MVRDQAAVRLEDPGAAHQGAGGLAVGAAARVRRRPRGGADHLGRASAQPAADGQGRPRPGRGALRVDRLHQGQRGQGGPREVRGVRPRRPRVLRPEDRRRRRQDRRRRSPTGACAPTWCRAASSRPPGCSSDWPEYDELLDPINRVFLPRADIATENLVAGLVDLGWECDDVTAYRTVRAAPPPAPTRDAIKGGKFDAVVFTSSSTVRNLVGIAGKPHPSTVIAVIGPATAKTAEEHGLRVDVLAPQARRRRARRGARRLRRRPPAGDDRGRPAGDQAVRAQADVPHAERSDESRSRAATAETGDGPTSPAVAATAGPAASAAHARRRCAPGRRDARWSRGSWCCRCSCARAPRSRARSRRCPASSSTRATRCSRPPHEAAELGLGGLMLFGIPEHKDADRLRRHSTRPASSTSRSPTWSPRSATRSP